MTPGAAGGPTAREPVAPSPAITPRARVDELMAPWRTDPAWAAVLTDFDGTLSPIVERPDAAAPLAGVPELLDRLARHLGLVAVVSGRPVSFLASRVPASVRLSGLYGLESQHDGVHVDHPEAAGWRAVVDDVASAAEGQGPHGMTVERKGLSLTLHYRARPDQREAVVVFAADQARRSGLVPHDAKMSVELRPPIATDKGLVVEALTQGFTAVCFLGDDRGDLPAFDALDRLARPGVHTVRIGVAGPEAPADVLGRADIVVDGPAGAMALLATLV